MKFLHAHDALVILKNSLAIPKLLYLPRTSECADNPLLQTPVAKVRTIYTLNSQNCGAHAQVCQLEFIGFLRKIDTTLLLCGKWPDFDEIPQADAEKHADYGDIVEIETRSRTTTWRTLDFRNRK